eukprot:TRINITY_DN7972_c0_g1_i1.p1 TRINITY_DN7972_c0_g1~~TRINITY_DN7972_c0_g1_i1.p1  ORF type:complete len:227 (+),score=48.72 TRINITY_DN7972_c0_g1_i1:472-1152(+)
MNMHPSLQHTERLLASANDMLQQLRDASSALKKAHRGWLEEEGLSRDELHPCEQDESEEEQQMVREEATRALAKFLEVNLAPAPSTLNCNFSNVASMGFIEEGALEIDRHPLSSLTADVRKVSDIVSERVDEIDAEVLDALTSQLTSGTTTCQVCMEPKESSLMYTFAVCAHQYCRSCLQQYFEVKIQEGREVLCPDACPVSDEDVRAIVSEEMYLAYIEKCPRQA